MHGGFHPKAGTLRLYAKRKEGGRGLVSVSTTVQDETMNIHEYITKMAPTDSVLSEYLRQQKPKKEEGDEEPPWKDRPLHVSDQHSPALQHYQQQEQQPLNSNIVPIRCHEVP
ncbi:uncharacterized protein LOC143418327 [Maylandia zebra]|uniref:uncharacterized protein LOC143418327 n=1 Tax=Maylandia zebra TaxID=106582 RepID=UPI00403C2BB9